MKRRKVTYPVAKTHTKGTPRAGTGPEAAMFRPNLVAIDVTAGAGRKNLKVGGRVRINGTGLYAGEEARIDASGRSISSRSSRPADCPPGRQWPAWLISIPTRR